MEMLLTVEQAAQRLQLTPYTVRAQLRQGKLRGIRRGRVWRIEESALLESTPAPARKAARRGFGLLANDPHATGARTVDDFLADRHAEAQAELEKGAV
jgi:excisionase family DNA binding protein